MQKFCKFLIFFLQYFGNLSGKIPLETLKKIVYNYSAKYTVAT